MAINVFKSNINILAIAKNIPVQYKIGFVTQGHDCVPHVMSHPSDYDRNKKEGKNCNPGEACTVNADRYLKHETCFV